MKPLYLIFVLALFIACSTPPNKQADKDTVFANWGKAYSSGEWEQTLFYLDTLKALGIDLHNDILIKAECYAGLGKYNKAISILEKEIELDTMPDIHYIYKTLGDVLYLKGEIEKAISAYKKTIDIRPSYARPYVNLGKIYEKQGDKVNSINNYLDAVKLFLSNYCYNEAAEFSYKVLDIDASNIDAHKYLDYALQNLNEYENALFIALRLDSILESKKLWDERHDNWLFTGMTAYKCKNYKLALDLISNAMQFERIRQDFGWLGYCYLSAISIKQGNKESAEKYANAAKELSDKDANAFIQELVDKK